MVVLIFKGFVNGHQPVACNIAFESSVNVLTPQSMSVPPKVHGNENSDEVLSFEVYLCSDLVFTTTHIYMYILSVLREVTQTQLYQSERLSIFM